MLGQKDTKKTVGASYTVYVAMIEDTQVLDEIVVTTLAISRDKKSLGYAIQEVSGEEVSTVKDANFINALSGKVSGLNIQKSNTLGGLRYDNGNAAMDVNPDDIESVNI
jgi:hypothetical protein